MSFDWAEYLRLGQQLVRLAALPVSDEARQRSALSRAYYAVYHPALRVAQRKGGYRRPRNTGAHEALIEFYKNHLDARWQAAGEALEALKILRVKADYHDTMPAAELTANNVRLALLLAAGLQSDVDRL